MKATERKKNTVEESRVSVSARFTLVISTDFAVKYHESIFFSF